MTDSSDDSDYNVEDYVKPEIVRRTYNNEDLLSDNEEASESDESNKSEGEADPDKDSDSEIKNPQCKLNNGSEKQPEAVTQPARANSRFILYVTGLSAETTRSILEDFFADAGQIKSIRIPKVRMGSFAFVEMVDIEGFNSGLKFNNRELDGKKIQVYPGSKNKKHASNKAKNLKRKVQQGHLNKINESKKMRKQTNE